MRVFKAFYAARFCYFSGKVSRESHACSCGHLKLFKGREKNSGCSQHAYPGNVFWSIIICISHRVAGLPSPIFWVCDLAFSLSSVFCKNRFFFCVVGATGLPGTLARGPGLIFETFLVFFPYWHNYQIFSNSCFFFFSFWPWGLMWYQLAWSSLRSRGCPWAHCAPRLTLSSQCSWGWSCTWTLSVLLPSAGITDV